MASNNAVSVAQQDYANTQNLIRTGLYMTKQLQPVTGSMGSQIRVPLDRTGIVTGVTLKFTVPINVTGAMTTSGYGPYNFAQQVTYTDFSGIQRVNTNGFSLHCMNSFKGHRIAGNAVDYKYIPLSEKGIDTNILNYPTATGAQTITFFLYVPLAYDPSADLRGAVLAQAIYGEHYITLQLPSALVGSDSLSFPFTAGTATIASGAVSVTAYQHYIMPQQGVQNLPMVSLSTIYAVEGNYNDSANIVSGQSKYVNWPNNRSIFSALHIFENGNAGVANGADLSLITLLGNSNTNIKTLDPSLVRYHMRYMLGADMPSGVYYLPSRAQPITTVLYGNVQSKFDVVTANSGAYFLSQYESTYLSGTPLPGIIQ